MPEFVTCDEFAMTRIDFHSNVADKLLYGCRLVRKAVGSGQQVVVHAEVDVLRRFDQLLWTFSPLDFLPHCAIDHPLASQTPVLLTSQLTEQDSEPPHHDILLNLGQQTPLLFARFTRLLEVVGRDDSDREVARQRFRFYRERGYPLQHYDQAGAT